MSTENITDAPSLAHALALLRQGEVRAAQAVCNVLLEESPEDAAAHQLAAAIALEQDDANGAWNHASTSLRLRPEHVPTLSIAGRALHLGGKAREALTMFQRAAELAPTRAEPAFFVCRILLELGDVAANPMLHHLLERFPADANGWRMMGETLEAALKPKAALVAYTRAAGVEPTWTLHLRRATVLQSLGRFDDAIEAFRAAQALTPDAVEPLLRLALCMKQAGDYDGAAAVLLRVLKLDDQVAEAWFALGVIEQDSNRLAAAIEAYQSALAVRPDLAEAAVNLGICLQNAGDLASAKNAYRQALRSRPDAFGRIAQAMAASPTGEVWLNLEGLRGSLGV